MSQPQLPPRSAGGPTHLAPRTVARIAGVLFLVTFVTAIPAVFLYLVAKGFKPSPITARDSSLRLTAAAR